MQDVEKAFESSVLSDALPFTFLFQGDTIKEDC
jgi:hypothetical protein